MADLNVALLGFVGVLVGGYSNNFLAEDYRRFRDGQALAGALAGELESHAEAIPTIKDGLEKMLMGLGQGEKLTLKEWPVPASPLFDDNASKIGLLGAQSARDVAYVYENIRAFRQSFHMLSKNHADVPAMWSQGMLISCLAAIERAENRGQSLIENLRRYAVESYWQRSQTRTQLKWGAAGFIVFLILLRLFSLGTISQ
ncbi:hypothetical protein BTK96_004238 [Burkholderia pyrrocinia]|uniref:hypothetical protein n=1 Tax=Burkholderia sp. IT-111MI5 TaxID=3026439 RepID=UPI002A2F4A60|nr:hypothetical protein [Burkholderia pyrrocinia]EKS9895919.1 hypothetical protein [Burkholderia pyrrocinia]EKS9908968.1 hypothetical protein [Burkholderia pyrrocinia]